MQWHLITGEFPPSPGGVSDYSLQIATGLAAAGDPVHVWCPNATGELPDTSPVEVHRVAGTWRPADLARLDSEMDATPSPRRLLVQWVPHAYDRRSLNVGFCRWVRRRGLRGDVVDLMVHEPFLAFREGGWRQDAAAAVHRLMAAMLLSVARRVWVAIPAWAARLRPWAFGRPLSFCWLPVPSSIPVVSKPMAVESLRAALSGGQTLFGHFGTYGRESRVALMRIVPALFTREPDSAVLLLGRRSCDFAQQLRRELGPMGSRVHATGGLASHDLSVHLQACHVLIQPYPDGASARRSTLMAALAHGLPIVTTHGRLSEPLWGRSGAVTTVAAHDHDAIVAAASALAADRLHSQEQGRMARQLYHDRFDLRHSIQALLSDACPAI